MVAPMRKDLPQRWRAKGGPIRWVCTFPVWCARVAHEGVAGVIVGDSEDEARLLHREVLGLDVERLRRLQRNLPHGAVLDVFDALDQMRSECDAVVGDDSDGLRLLHRRESVIALPDARRDRVAQVPFVLESFALPRARRQHAEELASLRRRLDELERGHSARPCPT